MRNDLLAVIGDDAPPLERAAKKVLRDALDNVSVHPCDQGDDSVAAVQLSPEMRDLLTALLSSAAARRPADQL